MAVGDSSIHNSKEFLNIVVTIKVKRWNKDTRYTTCLLH